MRAERPEKSIADGSSEEVGPAVVKIESAVGPGVGLHRQPQLGTS